VMFSSFFLAGFECATGANVKGEWIDQVAATAHDQHVEADYRRVREVGIRAVREAIRWPMVDHKGHYDFGSVVPFLDAARSQRIDVIWDLFHYGYPPDLDPFQPAFIHRFASYCAAAARFVQARTHGTCWFTPINEPSFFAWAGGEAGRFAPHRTGVGRDLKIILARAAIAGINAIRSVCPGARIVNVDPLCHIVPPLGSLDRFEDCDAFNHGAVFESWDMLSGRLMPELGGSREHLDVIGINYYWTNQWEVDRPDTPLADDDPRRIPLRQLVRRVWERYGGDLLITETSHVDDMRPIWLAEVERECEAILTSGIPLRGVCLYPILGMPEWHDQQRWTRMGLWDVVESAATSCRSICQPMLDALRSAQRLERRFAREARV